MELYLDLKNKAKALLLRKDAYPADGVDYYTAPPNLTTQQGRLAEDLWNRARQVGRLNQSLNQDGWGCDYLQPGENDRALQGVMCANCVFFRGPLTCEIVEGVILEGGRCRFWVIPEKFTAEDEEPLETSAEGGELMELVSLSKKGNEVGDPDGKDEV